MSETLSANAYLFCGRMASSVVLLSENNGGTDLVAVWRSFDYCVYVEFFEIRDLLKDGLLPFIALRTGDSIRNIVGDVRLDA